MKPLDEAFRVARARLTAGARAGSAHGLGIGGVGMAGLAALLRDMGWRVTGCDASEGPLMDRLRARGIETFVGHDPSHLDERPDLVLRSAAVPENEPELERARSLGTPVLARGLALAALVGARPSIAVAGTHGKTTTTAMLLHILRSAGRNPAFALGGIAPGWDGVGGGGEDPLVVEADESDGTLAYYEPETAVIGNIEFDHMEHFESEEAFIACFIRFAKGARGTVVYGADDPLARSVGERARRGRSFGLTEDAGLRGLRLREDASGQSVEVVRDGRSLGEMRLRVTGEHNARNALAALAAALDKGLAAPACMNALSSFRPVARRYERVVDRPDLLVISDYAHHPTEIRALVRMAQLENRRMVAVFQPHRFTRTKALGPAFPPAFEGVDALVLLPVYAASEAPLPGGASADLLDAFRREGRMSVRLVDSLDEATDCVNALRRPGDLVLIVGAGDVVRVAERLKKESIS